MTADPSHSRTQQDDLVRRASGEETGWWDDHGRPAPWPEDFDALDSGWAPACDPNDPKPGNPPF